jgi:N utilization substance protein A
VDSQVAAALQESNIDFIEDFLALGPEELAALGNVSPAQLEELRKLIEDNVEIVEEEEEGEGEVEEEGEGADTETGEAAEAGPEEGDGESGEAEEYECPECGAKITVDMTHCPSCGIGLSFEYED